MKNTNNAPARTVTITLSDLGNADLMNLYRFLDANEDTDQTTEIWLHVGETAEERLQGADAMQRAWIEDLAEAYEACFEEDTDEDTDDADTGEDEDTRTGLEMYLDLATQAYLDAPENSHLEAALQANAIDTNNDPNNLFRAGVFEGLAQAAAWGIYATSKVDDIHAITAAVYKAYGVDW